MQADKGHQIQEEKESLAKIQREVKDLQAGVQAAQTQLKALQARFHKHQTEKKRLEKEMQRAHEDMDRLDGEVIAAVPDTSQIELLEKELNDFQEQLKLDQEQCEDLVSEQDSASKNSKEHKRKADEATRAVEALKAKLEECRTKAHEQTQHREQALRRKNRAIDKVQEAEELKTHLQQQLDELQVDLETYVEEASKVCERVDVPRGATFDSLQRKLEESQKRRAGLERELGGSQKELQDRAIAAQKTWREAEVFVKNGEALRNSLVNALSHRREHWEQFRSSISLRARVTFMHLLYERRFRGELKVDHKRKALDMTVQPSGNVKAPEMSVPPKEGEVGRQTKTLSGGEKSFSTICLLLALWEAMGSPLRCLDEFDVFMDSVNRDVSMKMIIEAAGRATGRQYILITPQAMNNKDVKRMKDVTVIKMTDPERGQTALNFAR
jgi:chromosome segregation ATPase